MTRSNSGIDGPAQVQEGSTGTIEVDAPSSYKITVTVSTTGDEFDVDVDADGRARFQLPANVRAGATLLITDLDDPSISTEIPVVPATN